MRIRGWRQWLKNLLRGKKTILGPEELHVKSTNSDRDRALRETQYLMNRIQSTSGLWERLCDATNEGKPKCLSAIINIAREAGIIETDTETALSDEEPVTIYSEHHEAASHLVLSSEDSARLCVIVWALEGKRLKR
jgi:hypothetical protein